MCVFYVVFYFKFRWGACLCVSGSVYVYVWRVLWVCEFLVWGGCLFFFAFACGCIYVCLYVLCDCWSESILVICGVQFCVCVSVCVMCIVCAWRVFRVCVCVCVRVCCLVYGLCVFYQLCMCVPCV